MEQTNMASFSNLTKEQGSTTAEPHTSEFCQGISNDRFTTVDNSVPYFVNAALNAPVAIVTTFANLLDLLAMRHVNSIRLPSKLLLCSLVPTDLGTGLLVQPQYAVFLFSKATDSHHAKCALVNLLQFTGSLFPTASFLTMTTISLDRHTALFSHLKYQQIVTTGRVCAVLILFWSYSLSFSSVTLLGIALWRTVSTTGTVTCLLVTSVAYIKIYRRLRRHHVQPQAGNTLNMDRYRRTASAMMWVYVIFIICYTPYLCMNSIAVALGYTSITVCFREFTYTLLLLNSCCNPLVYCLRLPEIRAEDMNVFRKLCWRNSQG